jgi:hypothetical protein
VVLACEWSLARRRGRGERCNALVTLRQGTTVPLTAVDSCGEWPTFVGGGAAAF